MNEIKALDGKVFVNTERTLTITLILSSTTTLKFMSTYQITTWPYLKIQWNNVSVSPLENLQPQLTYCCMEATTIMTTNTVLQLPCCASNSLASSSTSSTYFKLTLWTLQERDHHLCVLWYKSKTSSSGLWLGLLDFPVTQILLRQRFDNIVNHS